MKLYHGSNLSILEPQILESDIELVLSSIHLYHSTNLIQTAIYPHQLFLWRSYKSIQ